jgi:hypothetical protein
VLDREAVSLSDSPDLAGSSARSSPEPPRNMKHQLQGPDRNSAFGYVSGRRSRPLLWGFLAQPLMKIDHDLLHAVRNMHFSELLSMIVGEAPLRCLIFV